VGTRADNVFSSARQHGSRPHRPRLASDTCLPTPATILVVDDQPFVRDTLCSLLAEQPHWKIYEAENGRVALERVREIDPDVVVLDIVMPEMNGMQAAYEIHHLTLKAKIVLISSHYTPQESAILAHLFGDGNFIPKSEAGKTLVPAVSSLLPEESQAH
jgi:DNA-binding NarL/FixJ family response regulator